MYLEERTDRISFVIWYECGTRKSQVKYDSQALDQNCWKNGGATHGDDKHIGGVSGQQVHFGHITFELLIDIQVDIIK